MSVETLLERLEKVRDKGGGNYAACCPAHKDRSPSLSIRDVGDGTVLLHCHAGCETEQVLAAVSMTFDDLFPERDEPRNPVKRTFNAAALLECIATETMIASVIAADMVKGKPISKADYDRLLKAAGRIKAAHTMAHG